MKNITVFVLLLSLFCSCKKVPLVNCPDSMLIEVTNTSPTVGEGIRFTAPKESDYDVYTWITPKNNTTTASRYESVDPVKYSDRGWYTCLRQSFECNRTYRDSIFIDVKLKQETPPCTLTNNFISIPALVNVTLSSVTQVYDPTYNAMTLSGSPSAVYPAFKIVFNSYNGNTEPIDGTYLTTSTSVFDFTQEYNEVSVSFFYMGANYHCAPFQNLYVSHAGGKLRVSFCGMNFSSLIRPPATCSGQMTEL